MAAAKTKTRTTTTKAQRTAAAKRKAKETDNAKAKAAEAAAAKAAKAEESKKAREAKKAEAEQAKVAEREALIDSGALIVDGDVEYHAVDRDELLTVESRAKGIIDTLKASDVPVSGKDLQDEFGGGWPQYLSIFATLKVLDLVTEYRSRTGERGGSGVAYKYNA